VKNPAAGAIWTTLARKHNGSDRWYLEALGIGADGQWDAFLAEYFKQVPDFIKTSAGKDIVWRARSEAAVPYLAALASDKQTPINQRLRYFRAFDFQKGTFKKEIPA
jgi:hypothetical protein